jgi:hypothetical protein
MKKITKAIETVKFLYAEFHHRRIANKTALIRGTILNEDLHRAKAAVDDVRNMS